MIHLQPVYEILSMALHRTVQSFQKTWPLIAFVFVTVLVPYLLFIPHNTAASPFTVGPVVWGILVSLVYAAAAAFSFALAIFMTVHSASLSVFLLKETSKAFVYTFYMALIASIITAIALVAAWGIPFYLFVIAKIPSPLAPFSTAVYVGAALTLVYFGFFMAPFQIAIVQATLKKRLCFWKYYQGLRGKRLEAFLVFALPIILVLIIQVVVEKALNTTMPASVLSEAADEQIFTNVNFIRVLIDSVLSYILIVLSVYIVHDLIRRFFPGDQSL